VKATYTHKQAIERLGLKNAYTFVRLERKYPEAVVIVIRDADKHALYNKAILDRFVNWQERFKKEQP
jgi:hypothetical protein